jgi:hypothetical protein
MHGDCLLQLATFRVTCRDRLGALAQAELLVHDVALKGSMTVGLCNLGFIGAITFSPSMMLLLLFQYVSVTTGDWS